ncbi:hypothetical protein RI129_011880 [Pyrocoelia pectoralis]|uniref:Retrotransposon gag domain-containing protein n=1 Tax=Pyrocoelia pectoralis TaxID=417401 RepID=A0AAN7V2Q1_9COLE
MKKAEKDFIVQGISTDKKTWYTFPDECKDLTLHTILSSKKQISNATVAIRNINGYRTIAIKLDDDIKKTYFDEVDNVCFQEFPLEEYVFTSNVKTIDLQKFELEERIKKLEQQLKIENSNQEVKLHRIEKDFILEKFEKKQHEPTEWLHRFEQECNRFQIHADNLKIQALRFFILGTAKDWYETNQKKIGFTASWNEWKDSFLNLFVDKGWSIVRKAFNYKYLGGSLIDYALVKEKLCLEVECKGSEASRINQIVFGLPNEAQEELDREEITTLDKLYTALRKLEDTFSRKRNEKPLNPNLNKKYTCAPNKKNESEQKNDSQRKPCSFCSTLGFPNRYHLVTECRNKQMAAEKLKTNITECSTNVSDLEILNIDVDNKNLN